MTANNSEITQSLLELLLGAEKNRQKPTVIYLSYITKMQLFREAAVELNVMYETFRGIPIKTVTDTNYYAALGYDFGRYKLKQRHEMYFKDNIDKQHKTIYQVITNSNFKSYKEAEQAVALMYVPDMSFDRGQIATAIKLIKEYWETKND